jgi:hypothetical protein
MGAGTGDKRGVVGFWARCSWSWAVALLAGLTVLFAVVSSARAARTYTDPWLEGDLQQIEVPQALDILARTPQHVIVGDIDSGARLSDPDLAPHLMRMSKPYTCVDEYGPGPDYAASPANGDFGCDFVGSGQESIPTTIPDGDPTDPYGHGTGTAAVIAAVPNNGIEGAGVAPNARVLPVRACYGGNPDCYNEPALDGMTYAVAMGATVINASWPPGDADIDPPFLSFISSHPNVLFDFAIGGTGQNDDPYTPLCTDRKTYPNVICVGLANPDDTPGTVDANTSTDVSAPGYAGVPSAAGARVQFGYTSGATAHVTGAAALLRGIAPDLSASTIRQVLVSTSRHVAGYQSANRADGIIDVEAAVRAVQQMDGLTTPAPGHGAPVDSPNPFPGQGAPVGPPTPTPPVKPTPPVSPKPPARIAVSLGKVPHSVHAGAALKLHLRVTGGTGTVTATLRHGRATLARATRRRAHGRVTMRLRVHRDARPGRAKLRLRIGHAKPRVRTIVVSRRRR